MHNNNDSTSFLNEEVLGRMGLKSSAKQVLLDAQKRGTISPREIAEMLSKDLTGDRQKMSGVLDELRKLLQNINVRLTVEVVHTHRFVNVPMKQPEPFPGVVSHPDLSFITDKFMADHGLVPKAKKVLLDAYVRGKISPEEIASLIPAAVVKEKEQLRAIMRWFTQLLSQLSIEVVIKTSPAKNSRTAPPKAAAPQKVGNEAQQEGEAVSEEADDEVLWDGLAQDLNPESDEAEEELLAETSESKENGLHTYYWAVRQYPLLKHEEIVSLSRRFHSRQDYEARNKMVVHNLRWVLKLANRYKNRGMDYDDLVQAGNMGLMIAAEKFDPEMGNHFLTYATWWIKQSITRALVNTKRTIRVPVHEHTLAQQLFKVTTELEYELGRKPTTEEIATRSGQPVEIVDRSLHHTFVPEISTATNLGNSDDVQMTLEYLLQDRHFPSPVVSLIAKEDLQRAAGNLRTFLAAIETLPLSERYKRAFKMYYALDGEEEGHTLESIGQQYGVTRERIRQMNSIVWKELEVAGIALDGTGLIQALDRYEELQGFVGKNLNVVTPLRKFDPLKDRMQEFSEKYQDWKPVTPQTTTSNLPAVSPTCVGQASGEIGDVVRVCAAAYGVTEAAIVRDIKSATAVWARRVCVYILKEKLGMDYPAIAQALGYAQPTAVVTAYLAAKQKTFENLPLKADIERIIAECGFKAEQNGGAVAASHHS